MSRAPSPSASTSRPAGIGEARCSPGAAPVVLTHSGGVAMFAHTLNTNCDVLSAGSSAAKSAPLVRPLSWSAERSNVTSASPPIAGAHAKRQSAMSALRSSHTSQSCTHRFEEPHQNMRLDTQQPCRSLNAQPCFRQLSIDQRVASVDAAACERVRLIPSGLPIARPSTAAHP